VLFDAPDTPTPQLTKRIGTMLANAFDYAHGRRSQPEADAGDRRSGAEGVRGPRRRDTGTTFFLKEPLTAKAAMQHVSINPAVDTAHAGPGVIYFLRLTAKATASRVTKFMVSAIYQRVTNRNWNTTKKLVELME
jgi:uncharacterized protein (DUF1697 family)